mmetsp:Transcript_40548/g.73070  ORF Transcript_40548/g.73070 Transcript_40548/m.73070 type:complete len:482 (+) Transcript_40548:761-2206(+)
MPPMHIRQPLQNPRGIKLGRNLRQTPVHLSPLNQIQQLPSLNQRQEHVDARIVLEGIHQLANERMVQLGHDGTLPLRRARLALIEQFPFRLNFECVRRPPFRATAYPHPPERAGPEKLMKLQFLQRLGPRFDFCRGGSEASSPRFFVGSAFAAQSVEVENDRFDVGQSQFAAFHHVAYYLHRLLTILGAALDAAELHVFVGGQRILAEGVPLLQDLFALGQLIAELIQYPMPHNPQRRLHNQLLLLVNDFSSLVIHFFNEGRQQFVLKVLKVRIPKYRNALEQTPIFREQNRILERPDGPIQMLPRHYQQCSPPFGHGRLPTGGIAPNRLLPERLSRTAQYALSRGGRDLDLALAPHDEHLVRHLTLLVDHLSPFDGTDIQGVGDSIYELVVQPPKMLDFANGVAQPLVPPHRSQGHDLPEGELVDAPEDAGGAVLWFDVSPQGRAGDAVGGRGAVVEEAEFAEGLAGSFGLADDFLFVRD